MQKKLTALIKSFIKPLLIVGLVLSLVLSQADGALAARSGGRIGGGSFRAPTRSMPAPSRSYRPAPSGGYYPGGGGFGLPFIMPYPFIMGGGGLFSILIFMAIAAFLVRSFRSAQSEDGLDGLGYSAAPAVSVAKVQVGLLSEARSLQADLNSIANRADTNTPAGLAQVLQESTLALMRHPEYWIYAGGETQQTKLEAAENQFNRLALAERSKFTAETLSNVNNVLKQAEPALPAAGGALVETAAPGEYIVVTMLVATQGKLVLPTINSTQDLRQALGQIGAVSSDNLMAVEILWTPQAEGDTLSSDDVVAEYPNLKLI
ncbi:MAG: DUF1517 domain-containing protein [Drouetiella hepatica Uher 2000/2452]|jgi:uncharacterized membrane protein|uniref:DUF1517 domain-containing protein n=1 Tax=Drouetiella hepatica Uher 2000/2452 TaxID=904376 RepID=A0A951ULE7_9CYAN|nr:DUF1517 domain-containing protein [Drouetiella hepatica Uher 2000/2452]